MNKTLIAGIVGIVLLAALVVGVAAYGPGTQTGQGSGQGIIGAASCQYRDQMTQVIETETYTDLVKLREETGRSMMPFVTDEQTFQQAKDRHAQMVLQYGSDFQPGMGRGTMGAHSGLGARSGQGAGRGQGRNCPMTGDDVQ